MDLIPFDDRVLVRPVEAETTTAGGVILPEIAQENAQRGTVVAVGDGPFNPDGTQRPMRLAAGDEVLYSRYGGTQVSVEGDDLLVLRESDVLVKFA